jgi:hypothetical protein
MSSCISRVFVLEQGRSGVLTVIIFDGVDRVALGVEAQDAVEPQAVAWKLTAR